MILCYKSHSNFSLLANFSLSTFPAYNRQNTHTAQNLPSSSLYFSYKTIFQFLPTIFLQMKCFINCLWNAFFLQQWTYHVKVFISHNTIFARKCKFLFDIQDIFATKMQKKNEKTFLKRTIKHTFSNLKLLFL